MNSSMCKTEEKCRRVKQFAISSAMIITMAIVFTVFPTFANYKGEITTMLKSMTDIIGTIFSAVGVILAIYSVGTLVLAFKNDDADSKQKASTLLVVSIVLIAFTALINNLDLISKIGN